MSRRRWLFISNPGGACGGRHSRARARRRRRSNARRTSQRWPRRRRRNNVAMVVVIIGHLPHMRRPPSACDDRSRDVVPASQRDAGRRRKAAGSSVVEEDRVGAGRHPPNRRQGDRDGSGSTISRWSDARPRLRRGSDAHRRPRHRSSGRDAAPCVNMHHSTSPSDLEEARLMPRHAGGPQGEMVGHVRFSPRTVAQRQRVTSCGTRPG